MKGEIATTVQQRNILSAEHGQGTISKGTEAVGEGFAGLEQDFGECGLKGGTEKGSDVDESETGYEVRGENNTRLMCGISHGIARVEINTDQHHRVLPLDISREWRKSFFMSRLNEFRLHNI